MTKVTEGGNHSHEPSLLGKTRSNGSKLQKYILVLGPPGGETSSFIKMAIRHNQRLTPPKLPGTASCSSCKIKDQPVHFIDAPCLGDLASAQNALAELVLSLKCYTTSDRDKQNPLKLTGIIYIHTESNSDSQALRRNLQMLKALIGPRQLEYTTFLIRLQHTREAENVHQSLTGPLSVFISSLRQPKIVVSNPKAGHEPVEDLDILIPYLTSNDLPRLLLIQDRILKDKWSKGDIVKSLQDNTQDTSDGVVSPSKSKDSIFPWQKPAKKSSHAAPSIPDHAQSQEPQGTDAAASTAVTEPGLGQAECQEPQGIDTDATDAAEKIESDHAQCQGAEGIGGNADDAAKKSELDHPQSREVRGADVEPSNATKTCEQNPSTVKAEGSDSMYRRKFEELKIEHHKLRDNYTSLCSHLLIQDNTGEDRITRELEIINREIGKLGYCISEHLFSNSPSTIIPNETHDPPRFQQLATIFGHVEGSSSLLKSSDGKLPVPADFVDYAVRGILCGQLYESLFKPFHPSVAGSDNEPQEKFLTTVYRQIIRQEPQPVAGRWRRDTFNSISSSTSRGSTPSTLQTITDALKNLLTTVSQTPVEELLTEDHEKMLGKLAAMADDWNQLVKAKVVFDGEFRVIAGRHRCVFQPDIMCKFGAKSHDTNHPGFGLAVVELGLARCYAVGGNKGPEENVLRRMSVIDEKLLYS